MGAGARLTFSNNYSNRLDGVAVNGTLNFSDYGARVLMENGAGVTGTVNLTAAENVLGFNQSGTVSGPLTVNMDADTYLVGSSYLSVEGDHTLTLGNGVTVHGQGQIGGQRFFGGTNALINKGTIQADAADAFGSRTLSIVSSSFTNEGTLKAVNGGRLTVPVLTNVNGSTIIGGKHLVDATTGPSALDFSNAIAGKLTVIDHAEFVLRGTNSRVVANSVDVLDGALSSLTGTTAVLRILDGRSLTASDTGLTSSGTIEVSGSGSLLLTAGNFTQSAGTTTLTNGGKVKANQVQIDGGTLSAESEGRSAKPALLSSTTGAPSSSEARRVLRTGSAIAPTFI